MAALHKSDCQSGDWQNAEENTSAAIVPSAEKLGNTKRLATLRARAALAGVTLHAIENDHGNTVYIVSRWAMTRELADLDLLESWLQRVGGAA